jgi:hypothetical protein
MSEAAATLRPVGPEAPVRDGPWQLLACVELQHRWGADGRIGALRWQPTAATADWLRRSGALLRTGPGRLELLMRAAQRALWQDADVPDLSWCAFAQEPGFAHVTQGLPPEPGHTFCFDSAQARPDDDGGTPWLHAGATADSTEVLACSDARLREVLGLRERLVPPAFVLSLPWHTLRAGGAAWRIAFGARAPVWKYCLIGDWPQPALQVVDLDQQVQFSPPVPEQLDDGRPVLAFRSLGGIALGERATQRFALHSRAVTPPRPVVPRLPVAGTEPFARETLAGVPTLVSAIYVLNPPRRQPWP